MFDANPVNLKKSLRALPGGDIRLPGFQRDRVWNIERIEGLPARISGELHVGAVMTLAAGSEIKFKPRSVEGAGAGKVKTPGEFFFA